MSATAFSSICFDRGHCWMKDLRKQRYGKPLVKCSMKSGNPTSQKTVRVGVLGASGYTGSEVLRLLANHPEFGVALLTADRKAGQPISSVFPHLGTQDLPDLIAIKDANFSDVDAVFCCLPHGTTQEIIKGLPKHLKIVDLSADFRLRDISEYEEWYGQPHRAPDLQVGLVLFNYKRKEAIYGLTEVLREEIKNARLVANPGCYPTSIQLPLVPLIKANLIHISNIIIDAKSGVSGAVPEIEQGLTDAASSKVTVSFTPHLIPMSRGMQSTIYVEMAPGVRIEDLYQQLKLSYEVCPFTSLLVTSSHTDAISTCLQNGKDEKFVVLLENGVIPRTHSVKGTNYCLINVFPDRIPGRAIIISVIDNLVKGASGQALQNLNLIMGFPENLGLHYLPLFP
ncbi:Semialdehyde dehydrogenase, NAD-binding [Sesbania bispinosa]|nr:Semialdehyde dehydrogenase, NAD-binding [Sesbania bispinosa]